MMIKKIFKFFISKLLNFFILCIIYSLKLINIKVFIVKIYSERIGHMAILTDYFLRKKNISKLNYFYLGISQKNVSNKYLFKLIKKNLFIFTFPLFLFNFLCRCFKDQSFFIDTISQNAYSDYETFNLPIINFQISKKENLEGKKLLQDIGLQDKDWFVCFHNRTSAYLKNFDKYLYGHQVDFSYHDFRDSKVSTYKNALDYIISKGGYVIRVGHYSGEKLDFLDQSKYIIDLSTNLRSDFTDIYLSSKCKFFLGGNAGISVIPYIFDRPLLMSNYTPIFVSPSPKKNSRAIPSLIWSESNNSFLHFKDIFKTNIWKFGKSQQFKENNLKVVSNNNDDLFLGCKEIFDYLEFNNDYNLGRERADSIKKKFNEILPSDHPGKNKEEYLNSICNFFYIKYEKLII